MGSGVSVVTRADSFVVELAFSLQCEKAAHIFSLVCSQCMVTYQTKHQMKVYHHHYLWISFLPRSCAIPDLFVAGGKILINSFLRRYWLGLPALLFAIGTLCPWFIYDKMGVSVWYDAEQRVKNLLAVHYSSGQFSAELQATQTNRASSSIYFNSK